MQKTINKKQTCGIKNLIWDYNLNDYIPEHSKRLKNSIIAIELLEDVIGDYDIIHKRGTKFMIYKEQIKEDGCFRFYGHGGYLAEIIHPWQFKECV